MRDCGKKGLEHLEGVLSSISTASVLLSLPVAGAHPFLQGSAQQGLRLCKN